MWRPCSWAAPSISPSATTCPEGASLSVARVEGRTVSGALIQSTLSVYDIDVESPGPSAQQPVVLFFLVRPWQIKSDRRPWQFRRM
jgi:hypothetical protein